VGEDPGGVLDPASDAQPCFPELQVVHAASLPQNR
jgi:hypothetical protein